MRFHCKASALSGELFCSLFVLVFCFRKVRKINNIGNMSENACVPVKASKCTVRSGQRIFVQHVRLSVVEAQD